MNYRFYNAKILHGHKIIEGELWVINGKIGYIGKAKVSDKQFDEEIDLNNKLIMPGLINLHAHTTMSWSRNVANDVNLQEWLYNNIFPYEAKLQDEDYYWFTMFGIKELVRNGITTCLDMYINSIIPYEAFKKAKYRAMLSISPREIEMLSKKTDLVNFCMQIHSVYVPSENEIAEAVTLAKKHNLIINMHLSETLTEMGDCNLKHKCTPTEYLDSFGAFDNPCICAHCVHLDDNDYQMLAKNNAVAVLNNSSNLKLASGIAPAYTLMKRGVNVCIGTDSVGSNNHIDMFKEMFLTATLSKGTMHDPCVITNNEVIDMATINGAKALKMDNIGELKEGNFADLIVLDINQPNYKPHKILENGLVYCANSKDVCLTMINGNILYRDGEYYLGEDSDLIDKKLDELVDKLTKR